jgi:hypothetical protein
VCIVVYDTAAVVILNIYESILLEEYSRIIIHFMKNEKCSDIKPSIFMNSFYELFTVFFVHFYSTHNRKNTHVLIYFIQLLLS